MVRNRHDSAQPRHPAGAPRTRLTRPRMACCLLLALAFLLCRFPAPAAAATPEYQVKAAFLYNFLKFVEWPAEALNSQNTLILGILGKDPFGGALEEVRDKSAKGRRVVVQRLHSVEEARECNLVFICASEKGRLNQVVRALQNSPVLTVSDQEGFCQAGGMINLVAVKNRVGFEVSLPAAARARLKVSSQLLKLAKLVLE